MRILWVLVIILMLGAKKNAIKPSWALQAHTAPLDILFYHNMSFPVKYRESVFISEHGSWNREVPAGYRVVFLKVENGVPVSEEPFLYHTGAARWPNNFRPVGLTVKKCSKGDCLYVSSDTPPGFIIEISYQP